MKEFDIESLQEVLDRAFNICYAPLVIHEIGDRRLASKREINAIQVPRLQARKRQRGLAQRLTRERSGVGDGAAYFVPFFDNGDPLAEDGGSIRAFLTGCRGLAASSLPATLAPALA